MALRALRRIFTDFRVKVFTLLEKPRGGASIVYHSLSVLAILASLLLTILATTRHSNLIVVVLFYLEVFLLFWFTLEFLLRLWSAGCKTQYSGFHGRVAFAVDRWPLLLVDFTSILASVTFTISLTSTKEMPTAVDIISSLHWLRFFQILRMFRIDRRGDTWNMLGKVVHSHWHELLSTAYIGSILLLFTSFVVFHMEQEQNSQFGSWAASLWWTLITFYSVGYGDMSPITWQGKLVTCLLAMFGIVFFILPAGILGSGFALKAQENNREQHMDQRRSPAAALIQSMWRLRAASEQPLSHGGTSQASWPSQLLARRGGHKTPRTRPSTTNVVSPEDGGGRRGKEVVLAVEDLEEPVPPDMFVLTQQIKGAVLMLRRMKYFAQKKHMKRAMKPYDIMDIVESYSAGHNDLVATVKTMKRQVLNIDRSLRRLRRLYEEEER